MRGEVGKDTPKKDMDFYDVTHDTMTLSLVLTLYNDLLGVGDASITLHLSFNSLNRPLSKVTPNRQPTL